MGPILRITSSSVLDINWNKKKRKETILSADKGHHDHQHETGEAVAAFRREVRSQGESQGHCGSVEPLESSSDILHWRRWATHGSHILWRNRQKQATIKVVACAELCCRKINVHEVQHELEVLKWCFGVHGCCGCCFFPTVEIFPPLITICPCFSHSLVIF